MPNSDVVGPPVVRSSPLIHDWNTELEILPEQPAGTVKMLVPTTSRIFKPASRSPTDGAVSRAGTDEPDDDTGFDEAET